MDYEDTNYSLSNVSKEEMERYKDRLSDDTAMLLLPALLIFGIILIFGTVGNLLVLIVYYLKFKTSYIRTAILALAVFDLVTCTLCVPFEILDMCYSYNYTSNVLCKGHRFLTTVVQMASGFALVCVANDRYRRICYPLRQQATEKDATRRMLLSCVIAAVLAVPATLVYGVAPVPTPIAHVNGLECSTSEMFKRHPLRMAYSVVLCLVFVAAFTSMIVYYILIGRKVLHQVQNRPSGDSLPRRRRRTTTSGGSSVDQLEDSTADGVILDGDHRQAPKRTDVNTNVRSQPTSPSSPSKASNGKPAFSFRISKLSMAGKNLGSYISNCSRSDSISSSLNSWRIRKTTFMLFIITLIFVVSFLPHLALKVTQAVSSSLLENLRPPGIIAYNVLVRSSYFNAAFNWFVYGLCSPKFRSECRAICGGVTFWTHQRRFSRTSDEGI